MHVEVEFALVDQCNGCSHGWVSRKLAMVAAAAIVASVLTTIEADRWRRCLWVMDAKLDYLNILNSRVKSERWFVVDSRTHRLCDLLA